ncbi:MAG: Hpt domain-containing protein [Sulfurimonas sp.]|jgi:HPt (histidine-containing phosphotransfer) domain-containing protein
MLIYNHQKEFIGIDAQDLEMFGFADLSELQAEVDDFADFFVKEPGFVHNFKHVHWIDFVTTADSSENPKAIIKTKFKNFQCTLDIKTLYLKEQPSSKAYLITLQNLKNLGSTEEIKVITPQIKTPVIEKIEPEKPVTIIEAKAETKQVIVDEVKIEPVIKIEPIVKIEPILVPEPILVKETPIVKETQEIKIQDIPTEIDELLNMDAPLNIEMEGDEIEKEPVQEVVQIHESVFDNGYIYDPQVASNELGLPVDLIEEFIEDFIVQAKEFKDGLYNAYENGDINNIKSLSHKLKGVAANLRIEDAHEVLTTINSSASVSEVKSNLDLFYKIISKLSGEKILIEQNIIKPVPKTVEVLKITEISKKGEQLTSPIKSEDDLILDFKDDKMDTFFKKKPLQQIVLEDDEDDLVLSFKDENKEVLPIKEVVQIKEESEDSDEMMQMQPNFTNIFIDIEEEDKDGITIPIKIDIPELPEEQNLKVETVEEEKVELSKEAPIILAEETITPTKEEPIVLVVEEIELPKEEPQQKAKEIVISYNKKLAANEIGLDDESFNELFDDYISEGKALANAIHSAIESNNPILIRANAIKLKGMCDNMRVDDLNIDLETIMNTQDLEVAKEALQQIDLLISKISKIES